MPSWLAPLFEVLSAVALRLLGSPRPPRTLPASPPPEPAQQEIRDDARAELARRREADAAEVYEVGASSEGAKEEVPAGDLDKLTDSAPQTDSFAAPGSVKEAPLRIPARSFTAGRIAPVRLVVLHTTENDLRPGVARAVASWFGGPDAPQASSHYVVDADETVQCVLEQDQAWGAPGANGDGVHVELCARAGWSSVAWAAPEAQRMLARAARLVAGICERHGLPVEMVQVEGLLDGEAGITTHAAVSAAWHRSTHWDPGASFPLAAFLEDVRSALESYRPS